MDSFANEKDRELLFPDRYTFNVLLKLLPRENRLLFSDHRDMILCYSEPPYPVWLWTRDNCPDQTIDKAWDLVAEYLPFSEGYRFIMKRDAAEYFIKRGKEAGPALGISMQMFAYDCPSPVKPSVEADGYFYRCTPGDVGEAASLRAEFFRETGEPAPPYEHIVETVRGHIERQSLFFWKDKSGVTVSCCNYKVTDDVGCIGCVLTKREYRRRHYAQNMVYQTAKLINDSGFTPMLYTNAGYLASNACYEKVGFELKGSVCTVSAL